MMAEDKEVIDAVEMESKRMSKLTERALEDKLHRLIGTRRGVLARITGKRKEVDCLKSDADNLQKVQKLMHNDFNPLIVEFKKLSMQIEDLLPEEEKDADVSNWVVAKMLVIRQFEEETEKWMDALSESKIKKENRASDEDETGSSNDEDDDVCSEDSASQVGFNKPAQRKSSDVGRSSVISVRSSVCVNEEAKLAGLVERAAALQEKQELELEEARIKAKLERLTLKAAIAEKRAQVKVLKEHERSEDGMNSYVRSYMAGGTRVKEEERRQHPLANLPVSGGEMSSRSLQFTQPQVVRSRPTDNTDRQQRDRSSDGILQVMQKQNMITEMMVTQQKQAQLPVKDISVFKGDPLTYRSFIRAFEQAIEQRADNDQDKLYYLQQYTAGEPQELVRSCEHMSPQRGFMEAKRLLKKHYGDELMIASAYIDKALKWPQIKSEDAKALNTYAIFLTGCRNTMEDVEFMEEMDNPTNMRIVVSKLPYKMRERWRNSAFEIKERRGHRARFADLVIFIDRQANVAMDPIFGELQDSRTLTPGKAKEKEKPFKSGMRGSSFATYMSVERKRPDATVKQASTVKAANAFETPCLFCQKNHTLETCFKIKELTHSERVEFLKLKGLCFGCLTQGHLSRTCKRRMVCKQCSQRHPDLLHIERETYKNASAPTHDVCTLKEEVSGAQKPVMQEIVGYTGAGETECILSIVPVKVRSRKSGRYIETYAFMDPGSTATFCTEEFRKKLNVKGKPTQILLSTMGQDEPGGQKLITSYMLSDLEVCDLEDTEYIRLSKVFTHSNIPVQKENIPSQEQLQKWPYLSEVILPHIDADVGLLIGANNPKAMEPWHIINSQDDGPYAVKTVLGWMVCGPLKNENIISKDKTAHYSVNRISVVEIEQLLVQQYNTDFPERHYDDKEEMSQEDKQFMLSVEKTIKFVDGHYCIGLPLRNEEAKLPNNRCVAEQRAASLRRKLQKNDVFLEDYKGFMESILDKGYAVEVPQEQLNRDDDRVWYVPHHGVYHPKKKKIRVVFDCTASFQDVSLNGQLMQGPDLTNTLIGALLRFREDSVAMMADIESMFYQVRVPEADANLLRFLWWPDGNLNTPMKEYRMAVHLFGATSSPSVASYALRRTAEDRRDTATRGMKVKSLIQGETWINGPQFLLQPESEWPQRPDNVTQNLQNDPEVKNITVNTITAEEKSDPANKLLQYYSSWDRLKRAVAWILRAKETLTDLKNKRKELQLSISQSEKDTERQRVLVQQHIEKYKSAMEKKPLTLEQLVAAETEIIRHSQAQWFPDEVKALRSNVSVKRNSQLYKLDPILQDGILRVGGRLDRSSMPEDAKHPAILSKHSRVATLILTDVHEKIGHCGRNYMLSQLRQKIWIPQATSAIRKLISECTVCRRLRGRVGEQKMANLPEDRLLPDKPPFTNVGVDFFGPFDVKRGRRTVKRYGVMFTCLTIRAVHIEVADSLDTSSCINALRRFISRRGQITIMRSDNGTNFVGAEKELREAIESLNQSQIEKAMQKKGIKWIFNSPSASHQGGVWERQIRTVRRILNALVKEQTLTDDSLQTLLCEVESIINDRPITSPSDDSRDLEPLTPNHLLLMKVQPNMPPGTFNKDDQYARRRWRQVQYLADLFWTRWTREYLPLLQERQKWTKLKRNFEPGDVVLVVDSSFPRNTWIMGRIIQTIPDSSGTVRRVKLQTKTSTLERPINKLCLLQEAM